MKDIKQRLLAHDWQQAATQLNDQGYTLLKGVLGKAECDALINDYQAKRHVPENNCDGALPFWRRGI